MRLKMDVTLRGPLSLHPSALCRTHPYTTSAQRPQTHLIRDTFKEREHGAPCALSYYTTAALNGSGRRASRWDRR